MNDVKKFVKVCGKCNTITDANCLPHADCEIIEDLDHDCEMKRIILNYVEKTQAYNSCVCELFQLFRGPKYNELKDECFKIIYDLCRFGCNSNR